jgi:hypothetical protein
MFQSFSGLLYHWHDVWSADGKFGWMAEADDGLSGLLPDGERAFGELAGIVYT